MGTWVTAYIGMPRMRLTNRRWWPAQVAVVLPLVATGGLLCWLGVLLPRYGRRSGDPAWSAGSCGRTVSIVLLPIGAAGLIVLLPVGVAAAVVLFVLRPRISRRETGWAVALGGVAAGGGQLEWLASGNLRDLGIALAQLPLMLISLLAGWGLARRVGWHQARSGRPSIRQTGRSQRYVRSASASALPRPGCSAIRDRTFEEDDFRAGWQVLHPGVAEEAWARVFSSPCSTGSSDGLSQRNVIDSAWKRLGVKPGPFLIDEVLAKKRTRSTQTWKPIAA